MVGAAQGVVGVGADDGPALRRAPRRAETTWFAIEASRWFSVEIVVSQLTVVSTGVIFSRSAV
jgi:hypothetical protein